MALVGLEGGVRAFRGGPSGRWASWTSGLLLLLVALTAVAGLPLLLTGGRPRELLHFVYAFLAFAAVPTADALTMRWPPRRRAVARGVSALVGVGVIFRLFGTG
jgi:hypothetical protein